MNTALAKTTCDDALQANETALNACIVTLSKKDQAFQEAATSISDRDKLITGLRTDLDNEKSKNESIFRNPFFWGLLGLGVGIAITK